MSSKVINLFNRNNVNDTNLDSTNKKNKTENRADTNNTDESFIDNQITTKNNNIGNEDIVKESNKVSIANETENEKRNKNYGNDSSYIIPTYVEYEGLGFDTDSVGNVIGRYKSSEYIGYDCMLEESPNHLMRKGTLEKWMSVYNEVIKGKVKSECFFAFSLASIITGALKQKTKLLAAIGDTSTGKTSVLDFAISMFSSTEDIKVRRTFNATNMALVKLMDRNNGCGVYLDDGTAKMEKDQDYTNFIYDMSNGIGRLRMEKSGNTNNIYRFYTNVLLSGESSLLLRCNVKNPGVVPRLIEINIEKGDLTSDKDEADRLQEVALNNYGLVANEFVKYMVMNNLLGDNLLNEYNNEKKEITEYLNNRAKEKYGNNVELIIEIPEAEEYDDVKESSVAYRVGNSVASVILAAKIANKALNMEFDVEAIRDCLMNASEENESDFEIKIKKAIRTAEVDRVYEDSHIRRSEKHIKELHDKISKFAQSKLVEGKGREFGVTHMDEVRGLYNIISDDLKQFAITVNRLPKELREIFEAANLIHANKGRKDYKIKDAGGKPITYFSVKIRFEEKSE